MSPDEQAKQKVHASFKQQPARGPASACAKVGENVYQPLSNKESDQDHSERDDANSKVEAQVKSCR